MYKSTYGPTTSLQKMRKCVWRRGSVCGGPFTICTHDNVWLQLEREAYRPPGDRPPGKKNSGGPSPAKPLSRALLPVRVLDSPTTGVTRRPPDGGDRAFVRPPCRVPRRRWRLVRTAADGPLEDGFSVNRTGAGGQPESQVWLLGVDADVLVSDIALRGPERTAMLSTA